MARDRLNSAPPVGNRHERMQRVRVGVTGLAAIILIVALATAIASGVRRSANASGAASATVPVDARLDNASEASTEPLAKLGITPDINNGKDGKTKPDKSIP